MCKKINILGTEYELFYKEEKEDEKLQKCDGYCDPYSKKIVVCIPSENVMNYEKTEEYMKKVAKHEIVHAFFFESGLDINSEFARNEVLVDWLAIQLDKMHKVMSEV